MVTMPNDSAPAHAGVRFPPPFVYVFGIAGGWALDRWVAPLPITAGPSRTRDVVAAILALVFVALFIAALIAFRRAHTTLIPNRPATAFVTRGPYAFTRNPMYLGLVALYVAAALWLNSWWALVLLPVVVIVIDRTVIAREERYLGSAFPSEYSAYRSRVRRWL
jgi:protein-S-isoprenylcysteine O-methyltransferase Ste14